MELAKLNCEVRALSLLDEAVCYHVHLLNHHLLPLGDERWNGRLFATCSCCYIDGSGLVGRPLTHNLLRDRW